MKTLKIEKYINGEHEKTIDVPAAFIDALAFMLPESGVNELQKHGIDLPAIKLACKEGVPYTKTIEIKEEATPKKVIISVV